MQDSKEYLFAAENLINEHTLYAWDLNEKFNPNWLTKRPILYPAILVFFKLLTFGNNTLFLFSILLAQNLISICIIRLIEKTMNKLGYTFHYGVATLILLFTPAQIIYANLIMSEIWLELILLLLLNQLVFEINGTGKTVRLALLCVAAMALKPVMIFLAFCLPVYIVFSTRYNLKSTFISLIPLCYFAGISGINATRTGYNQYSSISTINSLQYNTYTLLINKNGLRFADSVVDHIQTMADRIPDYASRQKFINGECRKILTVNWPLYVYLHVRGTLFCLLDPGRFDLAQFLNLKHDKNLLYEINKKDNGMNLISTFFNLPGLFLVMIFLINLLKLFYGFRFIFSGKLKTGLKLTLLFLPFYILLFTGPIGSSRFALPYFPIYLIIILIAIDIRKLKSV